MGTRLRMRTPYLLAMIWLWAMYVSVDARKSYHRQLCSATTPYCRVPFEDRPADVIEKYFTPKKGAPKGHLKPVGHKDFEDSWDGEIPTFQEGEDLHPEEFWNKYYPNEPFILKGAGKKHSAYKNWQSDEYIIKNFGHIKAKAENKNEDRLTDYCGQMKLGEFVDCPRDVQPYEETYINVSRFMKHYKKPKYDKYIISP